MSTEAPTRDDLPPASLSRQMAPLQRGAPVGRYIVLDRLGEGGMGVVYTAYDPELNRRIAVKLLHVRTALGSEGQARLLREAQALARVSHPNVIAVYDVGSLEHGRVFVAMELVDGITLRAWQTQQPRSWQEIVAVYRAAAAGLAAAHRAGLIHRDFKPDNVLVGKDGRVHVVDFGVARAAGGDDVAAMPGERSSGSKLDAPITFAGALVGTPAYMAPEQFDCQAADARTDQFSFAIALYEALWGTRPFEAREPNVPQSWEIEDTPQGRQVPAWLRRIVLRALAIKPEDRFPSMDTLGDALRRDPRITRARVAFALAAIASITAGAIAIRSATEHRAELCTGAERQLAAVWNEPRKQAAAAAFATTRRPNAADTWRRSAGALDSWGERWVAMRTDACRATRVRGEQSDEVLSLRMECLDRGLEHLSALVDVFARADPQVVDKAVQAAFGLESVDECADLATLRAPIKPPKDVATRVAVAAQRVSLARANALSVAGKTKESTTLATDVLAAARRLGYPPLEAEVLTLIGHNEMRLASANATATMASSPTASRRSRAPSR